MEINASAIRKAVIPAAGMGTRLLPITKAVPKEMLPVGDKPVIHYVVEEAVAAGLKDILIVITHQKRAIEDYFSRNSQLENLLMERGLSGHIESLRNITDMADIHFIYQRETRGLGDAILQAKPHVGKDPFVVLHGCTIFSHTEEKTQSRTPIKRKMGDKDNLGSGIGDPHMATFADLPLPAAQLVDAFAATWKSVLALEDVPSTQMIRNDIFEGELSKSRSSSRKGLLEATNILESPRPSETHSRLALAQRYVFTTKIFDCLMETPEDKNQEIQLADALRRLTKSQTLFGLRIRGKRHDISTPQGFLRTTLELGHRVFRR